MTDKTPNEAEPSVDPSHDPEVEAVDAAASDADSSDAEVKALLDDLDEDAELVAAARTAQPVKRRTSQAPVKKAAPTPRRSNKTSEDEDERVGPITFTKQSVGELKKVNWPTGEQLRQYFLVVLLFVLFIIAFVGLLDLGFVAALLKLFG